MIVLTLNKDELKKLDVMLKGLSPAEKSGITRKAFLDVAHETERKLKESITNNILKVRSGRLRSSIGIMVKDKDNNLVADIGSGVRQGDRVPYANIHETGGVIRPVNSKYLAVPLKSALTPAGVLKKKPREWPNTFVLRSKNGALIIAQKKGKRGKLISLFVLKKSVTIPQRRYMSRTGDQVRPRMLEIMSNRIAKYLSEKK